MALENNMRITKLLLLLGLLISFALLTVITQIGGLVLLGSLFVIRRFKITKWTLKFAAFIALYLITTWLFIPPIARFFGREKVAHVGSISPVNYMTVFLNRNYVRSELNTVLQHSDKKLAASGIHIKYLDAGFPFIDGFPLLPHLSHNDGKKLDISLIYQQPSGEISNEKKSLSGYGVFEEPIAGEFNQTDECKRRGYFQYDFPKYMTFGKVNDDLVYSNKGTRQLMEALLKNSQLGKVFIEPHLRERLKLVDQRIRFQGCGAVRHDDHIHIQLK